MQVSDKVKAWREELDKAVLCHDALDNSLERAYSDGTISELIHDTIHEFGEHRVRLVFSHTVRRAPNAELMPDNIRLWASKQPTYKLPPNGRQGPARFRELELNVSAEAIVAAVDEIKKLDKCRTGRKNDCR